MSRISPTIEGFRAALRWPSLTLTEITWRWAVGTTACALLVFAFIEFLQTLPVSEGDRLLLRTRHPALVAQAAARILEGSLNRVVFASLIGGLALTGLWILAATVGRVATVRALLQYFAERREAVATLTRAHIPEGSQPVTALLGLNFLRAAVMLAAVFGFLGAAILAGFASPASHPRPGLAFLLFLPPAALACVFGGILNWFLSLAALFAVRDRLSTLDAFSAAVTFFRERMSALLAVGTWTEVAHLALFIGASSVIPVPLAFIQIAPARLVFGAMVVMTLAYFAIADWLYVARLAGYICISEMPDELLAPAQTDLAPVTPAPTAPPLPVQATIDREETILSDVP